MMMSSDEHINSTLESSIEEDDDYKVYKVEPYFNSDKETFGYTIKGKTKDYVDAQQNLKNVIKKGKTFRYDKGSVKVLDIRNLKGAIDTALEVKDTNVPRGNAQMKLYSPGKKEQQLKSENQLALKLFMWNS